MTVSVVIPFYNLERYVRPCLDSVAAAFQRVVGSRGVVVEVLCVDDGSTDATGALLDEFTRSVAVGGDVGLLVRVIHKPNGGEGSARNAGVDASTGEWVTFLDGDDVWLPNCLEVAVPLLARHSDADIVALKYANFDDGAELPAPTCVDEKVFCVGAFVASEVILEVGVFPTFFRREFVLGGSFSALPLGADRLYMAQCFARARTVVKCDAVVHGYRVRAGSMARAAWNARKVMSQCDYAFGSLTALAGSGKELGREGRDYLASLWLSDVPNRMARLPQGERRGAWEHWRDTMSSSGLRLGARFGFVRGLLRRCAFSMAVSIAVARALRKSGIS